MALPIPDRALAKAAIDGLFARCEDIEAAQLALRDGRPFVSLSRKQVEAGRLAAMTSSLGALGHSVLRELSAGSLDHVLVDGSGGKLVISSVPGTNGILLLAVLAAKDARLGLVLGQSKICCNEVSASLGDPALARSVPD